MNISVTLTSSYILFLVAFVHFIIFKNQRVLEYKCQKEMSFYAATGHYSSVVFVLNLCPLIIKILEIEFYVIEKINKKYLYPE